MRSRAGALLCAAALAAAARAGAAHPHLCAGHPGPLPVPAGADVGELAFLLVLDPNWAMCWEELRLSNLTAGLLPWVKGLKDALTQTEQDPGGQDLELRTSNAPPHLVEAGLKTFRDVAEHVEGQGLATIELPSMLVMLYQLTTLDIGAGGDGPEGEAARLQPAQLRVTTAERFWQSVELTAVTGVLGAPAGEWAAGVDPAPFPTSRHDAYLAPPKLVAAAGPQEGAPPPGGLELGDAPGEAPGESAEADGPAEAEGGGPDGSGGEGEGGEGETSADEGLAEAAASAVVDATGLAVQWTEGSGRPKHVPFHRLQPLGARPVVLLPQIVSALRNSVAHRTMTEKHSDPYGWGVDTVRELLGAFLGATGAASVPPLEEYTTLPQKMELQRMYEEYYEADVATRTPPIPTVAVHMPGTPLEQHQLCYSERTFVPSQRHVEATARAIWQGILALERAMAPDSLVRRVQVTDEDDSDVRHYILKRDKSNGSQHVLSLRLPAWLLALECRAGEEACAFGGLAPWLAGDPALDGPPDSTGAAMRPGYLWRVAELAVRQSCGEPWLLQPKVRDMDVLEFRVYLIGGAQATGAPNDTAVYYVSGKVDNDSDDPESFHGLGGYAFMGVPEGYFWADGLLAPEDHEDAVVGLLDAPVPVWAPEAEEDEAAAADPPAAPAGPPAGAAAAADVPEQAGEAAAPGERPPAARQAGGGSASWLTWGAFARVLSPSQPGAREEPGGPGNGTCAPPTEQHSAEAQLAGLRAAAESSIHKAEAGLAALEAAGGAGQLASDEGLQAEGAASGEAAGEATGAGAGAALAPAGDAGAARREREAGRQLRDKQRYHWLDAGNGRLRRRQLWRNPELYDIVVQAALDNGRAVGASQMQNSSARNIFQRADIVLAWFEEEEGTRVVPLINEMSLLNSATVLISFWGDNVSPDAHFWPAHLREAEAQRLAVTSVEERVCESHGRRVAAHLLREALAGL